MSVTLAETCAHDDRSTVLERPSSTSYPINSPVEAREAGTNNAQASPSNAPSSPVAPFEIQDDSDPNAGVPAVETWKNPRSNIFKLVAVYITFFNLGISGASYGALIPAIERYYEISYLVVSVVFFAPVIGYAAAAALSDKWHMWFGRRGVALFAPSCRITGFVALSLHPPYPVIVAILVLGGLGNGLLDAGGNSWVSSLARSTELLGMLHGFWGLGATLAPVIATSMITTYQLQWYTYYYVMVGLATVELGLTTAAFWREDGGDFRRRNANSTRESGRTRAALKQIPTWLVAFFLLVYVGAEVSLGGWIVTFMLRVRNAQEFAAGMTATGFWLGITVGRVVLGFITPRIGEQWAVLGYLIASMGLELLFWLVPQFLVSAVSIGVLGFFLGPIFPAAVIAISKILPRQYHVGAIGFATAVGGGGAALLPFAVGAIAQAKGVQVLQPIILALIGILAGLWISLPKISKHSHSD